MQWIVIAISVFVISSMLTGIIIPQILLISFRKRLFDIPDERKIHKAAVPRLGGLAFMPSIVLTLSFVSGCMMLFAGDWFADDSTFSLQRLLASPKTEGVVIPLSFGMCALMLMYLIGIADDLVGVKYRAKFVTQILAGLMLVAGGIRVDSLHGLFGVETLPPVAAALLTVFLVVFITNAINLIDGIDGLASGLSAIAMIYYGMFYYIAGHWLYSMISFAALGTLVPFFYYNVFGNAACGRKIFMGDTGALTTGLLLSFLSIGLTDVNFAENLPAEPLVVAFVPLAVPCLDVIRVFVHRVMRGNSPFLPDRVHIHHKLLALGLPQRPVMILILLISTLLTAFNLYISSYISVFAIIILDLVVWAAGNYLLTRSIRTRQMRKGITQGYE